MTTTTSRIAVVTGGRSDWGLLQRLCYHLTIADINYSIIATGASDTEADVKVDMLLVNDTDAAIARSTGIGVYGMVAAYEQIRPDIVVLLGDRFETFAAAQAAYLMRIPIAHLHGGEVSRGSLDQGMRDAITCMSTYHFVSCEKHKQRVIELTMSDLDIFNVGAIGVDLCQGVEPADVPHPFALISVPEGDGLPEIMEAVKSFGDLNYEVIGPNPDAGRNAKKQYMTKPRFDNHEYLSLLKAADVAVGNSSSFLIEAHALGTTAILVGNRQEGRVMSPSVITCPNVDVSTIAQYIEFVLNIKEDIYLKLPSPFGDGHAAYTIANVLKGILNDN